MERRGGIRQNPCIFAYFLVVYYIPYTDVQYKSFLRFLENFYEINSKMNKHRPFGCPARQNAVPHRYPAGKGVPMCHIAQENSAPLKRGAVQPHGDMDCSVARVPNRPSGTRQMAFRTAPTKSSKALRIFLVDGTGLEFKEKHLLQQITPNYVTKYSEIIKLGIS